VPRGVVHSAAATNSTGVATPAALSPAATASATASETSQPAAPSLRGRPPIRRRSISMPARSEPGEPAQEAVRLRDAQHRPREDAEQELDDHDGQHRAGGQLHEQRRQHRARPDDKEGLDGHRACAVRLIEKPAPDGRVKVAVAACSFQGLGSLPLGRWRKPASRRELAAQVGFPAEVRVIQ
jgi:hypothetical protein